MWCRLDAKTSERRASPAPADLNSQPSRGSEPWPVHRPQRHARTHTDPPPPNKSMTLTWTFQYKLSPLLWSAGGDPSRKLLPADQATGLKPAVLRLAVVKPKPTPALTETAVDPLYPRSHLRPPKCQSPSSSAVAGLAESVTTRVRCHASYFMVSRAKLERPP